MDLLKDLKMSLLSFIFITIYTIHKILELIKNHLNYLKDNIFERFFNPNKVGLFEGSFPWGWGWGGSWSI